ncbi:Protein-glutamate methylesterase/protein-glutamine glutaminase (plasmid) [Pseudoseohaeicola sp. NH-UV-7]|uniref:chemotaxis protein CheB n=1 Tax=Sulfitobacter sp. TBRI5 TaxID=2989732 RepID=UPI003A716772
MVKKKTQTSGSESSEKADPKPFLVVGLGASAGGLEAFTDFMKAVPEESGMAFVLVHHVDPEHKSMMAELLSRHTKMPVVLAENNMPVVPNHVYVIPPNRYMEIEKGALYLTEPHDARGTRLPINRFLLSLARDQKQNSVAVILSGTGTDGSSALNQIKAHGGVVLVQDPDEAQHGGMPRSAIASGAVDRVMPIAQMPGIIADFARHIATPEKPQKAPLGEKAREALTAIVTTLKAHSPINFDLYKDSTLLRRIERRMVLRHMQNAVDYNALLMDSPEEAQNLCRDLLISVTSFFRDPDAYAFLEKSVLPDLIRQFSSGQAVRVWVPACATGEEAYSIAMLLLEQISNARKDIKVQIFASDVDTNALAIARNGVYPDSIANDVSRRRLERFFVKEDHSYRATRELRDSVVFANQNILSDAPFSKLDLVSCRNLLIYLTPEAQKQVFETFHFALNDGGTLFLGMAETVGDDEVMFKPVSKKYRVYKRSGPSRARHLSLGTVTGTRGGIGAYAPPPRTLPGGRRLAEISQRLLIERYSPAAALVNENGEALYLEGRTDKYLKVPSGEVSRDLLAMAREGLHARLGSTLRAARETGAEASGTTSMMRDGQNITVDMTAHPVDVNGSKLILVAFRDANAPSQDTAQLMHNSVNNPLLEQELEKTRADLRNTIREYELTTEDLKASNEEAMSMNEEFQSTNEELETSKEELQSLNEELTTLNSQLQQKIEAERHLSDDLNNLLASSGVATIFLNREHEIMRFTPTARELFSLISKDIGRPISDITSSIDDQALFEDIARVRETLVPRQIEVQAKDGKWYIRRILPYYRTQDEKIDGVVITFSDVTALKDLQSKSIASQRFAENIVNTVREPLLVLNSDQVVVSASRSFHRLFHTKNERIIGKSLFSLAGGQWDIPELRRHLNLVLPENLPIEAFSVTFDIEKMGKRSMVLNARKVADTESGDLILLALEDVTDQKEVRQAMLDREARLSAILNAVPEAIITINTSGIVTSYSPPSARMLGYTRSEMVGRNVNMLMPEPHHSAHDGYISSYLETGEAKIIGTGRDVVARHKSGKPVPVHLKVAEVTIDGERQFIGIIRDLTEETESRQRLEQAQKMEAVGQLTGGIAHDFNNLLTVIIGNIELLEMRPDDPSNKEILNEALGAANLGALLVGKLLSFSKRQPLTPERLELTTLVKNLLPFLKRTLGAQIEIRTGLDGPVDPVMADPGQIENAVLNMAINARDAMPDGGTLNIRAQNVKVDADHIPEATDLADGDYVALSISDTGTGMPPEVLERVFEPFFTTKDQGKGTGLGLPMMLGLARQSGGDVTVSSEPGKGSIVTLYLPAIDPAEPAKTAKRKSDFKKGEATGETILLVEDDLRVRNLARNRLEHLGYSVIEAANGPAALKQLEQSDAIRLMLSDITMPGGMNGYELARTARELYPDLPIILASGFAPDSIEADKDGTLYPLLRKPYDIRTLAAALRQSLGTADT